MRLVEVDAVERALHRQLVQLLVRAFDDHGAVLLQFRIFALHLIECVLGEIGVGGVDDLAQH